MYKQFRQHIRTLQQERRPKGLANLFEESVHKAFKPKELISICKSKIEGDKPTNSEVYLISRRDREALNVKPLAVYRLELPLCSHRNNSRNIISALRRIFGDFIPLRPFIALCDYSNATVWYELRSLKELEATS